MCFRQSWLASERIGWWHGLVLALALILLRAWSFAHPIVDVDEPQFALFAHALLDGGVPYVASVDTKPLGVYWFFAAIFALFGRYNMIAVHAATALWVGLTALVCFRIAKRLATARAGFWAALFYLVFTTAYVPKFIGTSIVPLMMLPLAASVDQLLAWEGDGRRWRLLLSGVMWGAACLFKYQAGIQIVVVGSYLLLARPLVMGSWRLAARPLEFLLFLGGGAAVGIAFALYLRAVGAWDAFLFWSLEGSAAYVGAASQQSHFLKGLFLRGGSVVASGFLMWWLGILEAGGALRDFFQRRGRSPGELLVVLWLLLSLIPVCTGGKFYGHYFVQLFPALCVLCGLRLERLFAKALAGCLAIALVAIGLILPAAGFTAARFASGRIYAAIGEENPEDYRRAAAYVRERTEASDPIFVWGFATPIYFYAERPAASRFLWCDWLTGRVSGTPSARDPAFDTAAYIKPGSWKMFFEDVERSRPAYVVDTSPGNYHDYGKYPVAKFPALAAWLEENYRREATVDQMDLYRRVTP